MLSILINNYVRITNSLIKIITSMQYYRITTLFFRKINIDCVLLCQTAVIFIYRKYCTCDFCVIKRHMCTGFLRRVCDNKKISAYILITMDYCKKKIFSTQLETKFYTLKFKVKNVRILAMISYFI